MGKKPSSVPPFAFADDRTTQQKQENKMSRFERLASIDCRDHIEKKGKFSYLSWAWAWDTLKRECPEATFTKHTFNAEGNTTPYMTDHSGFAYVMVSVHVEDETQTEVFPVLNHSNKPIQNPNSFDVNTALQRALVKAIAMLGLGLYIYAGEDVPEGASPYTPKEEDEMYRQSVKDELQDVFK